MLTVLVLGVSCNVFVCAQYANDIADLLAPQSGAYYDVWLDGEKFVSVYKEVGWLLLLLLLVLACKLVKLQDCVYVSHAVCRTPCCLLTPSLFINLDIPLYPYPYEGHGIYDPEVCCICYDAVCRTPRSLLTAPSTAMAPTTATAPSPSMAHSSCHASSRSQSLCQVREAASIAAAGAAGLQHVAKCLGRMCVASAAGMCTAEVLLSSTSCPMLLVSMWTTLCSSLPLLLLLCR
jgi:hypothetical protein